MELVKSMQRSRGNVGYAELRDWAGWTGVVERGRGQVERIFTAAADTYFKYLAWVAGLLVGWSGDWWLVSSLGCKDGRDGMEFQLIEILIYGK